MPIELDALGISFLDDSQDFSCAAINRANLAPGWNDVVLTTYFNGATGPYTMQVSSQSCGGGLALGAAYALRRRQD